MTKTAMIIALYYPPINNGGVQRPASFAKYLPLYGYKPVVVTCEPLEAKKSEDGILRVCDPGAQLTAKGGIRSLVFRGIRKTLFKSGILPGYYYWWCKEVLMSMQSIMEKHRPDIILATFPPQDNLMIGTEISKKYNVPLVLDFRDGMVFEPLRQEPISVKLRFGLLEKQFQEVSTRIITVTDPITEYFNTTYPGHKACTISNGFDSDEWVKINKIDLGKKINIVYTGRLSLSRSGISVEPLIKAIDGLNENEKNRIYLYMVGDFSKQEKALMLNNAHSKLFNIVGFVDRKTALQYQYSADLLLLIAGHEQQSVAPGKLFEYLAASRPIFGLTAGTAAEEIIYRTGTGICLAPNDIHGITMQLKQIIRMYPRLDFFKPDPEQIERYSRKVLTKQLAEVFNQVLGIN